MSKVQQQHSIVLLVAAGAKFQMTKTAKDCSGALVTLISQHLTVGPLNWGRVKDQGESETLPCLRGEFKTLS